jgi:1,4-dihydroxy-2-naphthoate polyprenyltransferase
MASSALQNWGEIIRTQNLSPDKEMDPVSRWLLITRASVFPMTIISALIGGLLAARAPGADAFLFTLSLVGLVLAHAANNMINDYFDLESGVDSDDYVRAQYAPHPVLSGLISKKGLLLSIALVNLVDLVILLVLAEARGPALVLFALLGLFVSVFYVAPPIKLKHHGLGEPGVFVVWGPLMIGGTYYATAGTVEPWVLLASMPYALLVTCVLMGKHVDKIEADTAKGIRTLPVILGRDRALALTRGLIIAFFPLVLALVAIGWLGVFSLLSFAAIPRVRKVLAVFRNPRPAQPPPRYPLWPLWYVSFAFLVTRSAGGWFVIGLLLDAIVPIHLPRLA